MSVETPDYAAMLERMIVAYGRRVASPATATRSASSSARRTSAIRSRSTVSPLRENAGYSWAEVGAAYGISKQAAQQRFGKPAGNPVSPGLSVAAS